METALDSPDITFRADKFADILRSLHAARSQRQEASRATKRPRQALSDAERAEIFAKSGGKCHICGDALEGVWEADHVLVQSDGGNLEAGDYLAAHPLCNNYRWDYSPAEFQHILKLGVWLRTQIERKTPVGQMAAAAFLAHEDTRQDRKRFSPVIQDQ